MATTIPARTTAPPTGPSRLLLLGVDDAAPPSRRHEYGTPTREPARPPTVDDIPEGAEVHDALHYVDDAIHGLRHRLGLSDERHPGSIYPAVPTTTTATTAEGLAAALLGIATDEDQPGPALRLEHYLDDVRKHDREYLDAMEPGTAALWIRRSMGSHASTFGNVAALPATVRYAVYNVGAFACAVVERRPSGAFRCTPLGGLALRRFLEAYREALLARRDRQRAEDERRRTARREARYDAQRQRAAVAETPATYDAAGHDAADEPGDEDLARLAGSYDVVGLYGDELARYFRNTSAERRHEMDTLGRAGFTVDLSQVRQRGATYRREVTDRWAVHVWRTYDRGDLSLILIVADLAPREDGTSVFQNHRHYKTPDELVKGEAAREAYLAHREAITGPLTFYIDGNNAAAVGPDLYGYAAVYAHAGSGYAWTLFDPAALDALDEVDEATAYEAAPRLRERIDADARTAALLDEDETGRPETGSTETGGTPAEE